MLISHLLGVAGSTNPTRDISSALAKAFEFIPDAFDSDNWPSRKEVQDNLTGNAGRLKGDCDDHAFAAAYALHDLGVRARVVTGINETGEGHMVCEDEFGAVIDNRHPGRVLTWNELERLGYRSARMNSLDFEAEPEPRWHYVKINSDGRRDYA